MQKTGLRYLQVGFTYKSLVSNYAEIIFKGLGQGPRPVWTEKIAKYLQKLPKNDLSRKMIDFETFT